MRLFYRLKHPRALAKLSGLQTRVWMHYAAGGGLRQYRTDDATLAFYLECKRERLVEARQKLLAEGLLERRRATVTIPKWLE